MKKDMKEMWINSGGFGKLLIVFVIIFICLFAWNVFINNIVLKELVHGNRNVEKLIEEQAKIKYFRNCVKIEYDETMGEFNNNMLMILGKTLNENNIAFPQELNESIRSFREKADKIKDCLIDPEDFK